MSTLDMNQTMMMFLMEIGRFAASELKERWFLRRKQSKDKLELKDGNTQASKEVRDLLAYLEDKKYEQTVSLIKRKFHLIQNAKHGQITALEEYEKQRMSKAAYDLNIQHYDQEIKQLVGSILSDFSSLDVEVERKSLI